MIFQDNDFQDMDSGIMYIRDFELRDFVRNPCAHIQFIYELYKGRSSLHTDLAPPTPAKKTRQYFTSLRQNMGLTNENSTPELETETELDCYLLPIDDEAEPLLWWQAHTCEFPVLSSIAH